jgi:hypothetical protein
VVNGLALNVQADGTLRKLEELVQQGQVLAQFFAYDPRFFGGVNVTAADLDGDGVDEIITGAEQGGGPHVRVFNLAKGADIGFFVYEPTFTGGTGVAAGDVNGDGVDDLIVGSGNGGGPRVVAIDYATGDVLADFFAFEHAFRGGARVAVVDVNDDGESELIVGTPGHIRRFLRLDDPSQYLALDEFDDGSGTTVAGTEG